MRKFVLDTPKITKITLGICSVVGGVVQLHGSLFQHLLRNYCCMHACRVVEVSLQGFQECFK